MPRKTVLYARKSCESEDRQVLSLRAQVDEMREVAVRLGLKIDEVLTETKSAKQPGREVFGAMMARAEAGEIGTVLCWRLDRLSRNPVDSGRVMWALDAQSMAISTPSQTYSKESTLLTHVEFGVAEHFLKELTSNVIRGTNAKLARGGLPGRAPLGYLNDRIEKTVVPDPERFPLVRRMWELALSGAYTIEEIRRTANREWGLRTPRRRRMGGVPLSSSQAASLFRNKFYAGVIERRVDGVLKSFDGAHKPMITLGEFRQVQEVLRLVPRSKPETKSFAYTGLMRCGECGLGISAEEKIKKSGRRYVYYRCTRPGRGTSCSQKPINELVLEEQFREILDSVSIPSPLEAWGTNELAWFDDRDQSALVAATDRRRADLERLDSRLERLMDLRLDGLIDNEGFQAKKQEIESRRAAVMEEDKMAGEDGWTVRAESALKVAATARKAFEARTGVGRKVVMARISSNYLLRDRKVTAGLKKTFSIIAKYAPAVRHEVGILELTDFGQGKQKAAAIATAYPGWSRLLEELRTSAETS